GDLGGRRERALEQRAERVAHLHVVPVPLGGARLPAVFLLEARDVLGRPLGERGLAVLLLLACLAALDADPGVVGEPDAPPVLVGVDRLVGLVERARAGAGALTSRAGLTTAGGATAGAK